MSKSVMSMYSMLPGSSIVIKATLQPRESNESPEACVTEHGLDVYVVKRDRLLTMCPFAPPSAIIM
eukprot:14970638-Ditylum_brightwellii.AAC.1